MDDKNSKIKVSEPWRAGRLPGFRSTNDQRPAHGEIAALQHYWGILVRRKGILLAAVAIFVTLAALISLKATKLYRATSRIAINRTSSDVLGFKGDENQSYSDEEDYNIVLDTQVEVLNSDALAESVVNSLHLDKNPKFVAPPAKPSQKLSDMALAGELRSHLSVAKIPHTRIITISYLGSDPKLSADIVNSLVQNFIEYNFTTKFKSAMQTSEWLSRQLSDLQLKVSTSEEQLVKYQKENGIVEVDEKQNIVIAKLNELNNQLTAAEGDRIQKEATYRQSLTENVDDLPAGAESRSIQHLKELQQNLSDQLTKLSAQYGDAHPKVEEAKQQLDRVNAEIQGEGDKLKARLKSEYETAVARESMLTAALNEQKQEANALNQSAIEYEILKREADSNRQLYEGLLTKMKEASVSAGLRSGNVQVVDAATAPERPAKPNIPLNLGLALFAGVLVGAVGAFVVDMADNRIAGQETVEAITGWPSLGLVPQLAAGDRTTTGRAPVAIINESNSRAAEAYRAIRTSLLLSDADRQPTVIMVTSAIPEEGKTTVSTNLAAALAQTGGKVLLIDADLRRPMVHSTFGFRRDVHGLSTVLTHADTLESIVVPHPDLPNLDILTAGPRPPHPAELLGSDSMKALLAECRRQYQHIVIDTPPVLLVTDSVSLTPYIDTAIIVVRAGHSTRHTALEAHRVLASVNAKVAGFVLNGVMGNSDSYYYYRGYSGNSYEGYFSKQENETSEISTRS